jgi:hypothetical protein
VQASVPILHITIMVISANQPEVRASSNSHFFLRQKEFLASSIHQSLGNIQKAMHAGVVQTCAPILAPQHKCHRL